MKFSLFLHVERYDDQTSIAQQLDEMTELVQIAERGGFEAAWVGEHHGMGFTIAPNPFVNLALPGPVRLGQEHHALHHRRLPGSDRGHGAAGGPVAARRAAQPAQHRHGVPALHAVPAPERGRERGLSAAGARLGQDPHGRAREGHAQAGAPGAARRSQAVTHDQEEALRLSDRIAVFNQGRIEQVGSGHELYEHPATRFVAGFIGNSNFLPVRLERRRGDVADVVLPDGRRLEGALLRCDAANGADAALMLRPNRLNLLHDASTDAPSIPVRVTPGPLRRMKVGAATITPAHRPRDRVIPGPIVRPFDRSRESLDASSR